MKNRLPKPSDDRQIVSALIHQVSKAVPAGKSEQFVVTTISRPLWRKWCVAVGDSPDCNPTEWIGIEKTKRIYGSETIVVESNEEFSVSVAKHF